MFRVTIPAGRPAERGHILKVILGEFLGLPHRVEEAAGTRVVRIEREGNASGRAVIIKDELLALTGSEWLSAASLPKFPLSTFKPPVNLNFGPDYSVPAMYPGHKASDGNSVLNNSSVVIDFDLFGSAFFLLTCYEEVALDVRDQFERFPARESAMFKAGALDRPLVDEYTEILKRALAVCWPGTAFRQREFKIVPTHDVDCPYDCLFMAPGRIFKRVLGRLVRRGSWKQAREAFQTWKRVRAGDDLADPYFRALPRLMELSEAAGLQSRFYFLAGHTDARYDMDYQIGHPRIRRLLRSIHERGHHIGLHPSYNTLGKPDLIGEEFTRLKQVCAEEGITQDAWSARSHYLRWDSRHSFRNFDAAGFDFDSTLSFADHAGFRCGTCHEFSAFDLISGKTLRLREQPLIAMEASILRPCYQGLKYNEAAAFLQKVKERCRAAHGQFIFLWHNNEFPTGDDWELYTQQLQN